MLGDLKPLLVLDMRSRNTTAPVGFRRAYMNMLDQTMCKVSYTANVSTHPCVHVCHPLRKHEQEHHSKSESPLYSTSRRVRAVHIFHLPSDDSPRTRCRTFGSGVIEHRALPRASRR
ncbi:hypothetical protein BD311DRAFT_429369 [Dichomitus squalens]|uniref:Uncharacterized protein n=1 Tax=Dichomitus squalens TaxID=114155 RepID=A0A4Q9MIS1_9APHY|nr:hypothetical protein BD311DRAFT_429369 [Dichomitus squalens]